jgi:putative oxidoreductase
MKPSIQTCITVAGRVLLSLIFVLSGLDKIANWSGTAQYMASKGLVAVPFFLVMAILFELVGGLSVLTGFKARWGALVLVLFLIPVTAIFHNFWAFEGMERQMQMIHFMRNLAIMGGLLSIVARGAGLGSVDECRACAR